MRRARPRRRAAVTARRASARLEMFAKFPGVQTRLFPGHSPGGIRGVLCTSGDAGQFEGGWERSASLMVAFFRSSTASTDPTTHTMAHHISARALLLVVAALAISQAAAQHSGMAGMSMPTGSTFDHPCLKGEPSLAQRRDVGGVGGRPRPAGASAWAAAGHTFRRLARAWLPKPGHSTTPQS
jgi:hypothetical protein